MPNDSNMPDPAVLEALYGPTPVDPMTMRRALGQAYAALLARRAHICGLITLLESEQAMRGPTQGGPLR